LEAWRNLSSIEAGPQKAGCRSHSVRPVTHHLITTNREPPDRFPAKNSATGTDLTFISFMPGFVQIDLISQLPQAANPIL
jgi:hypothetical protein